MRLASPMLLLPLLVLGCDDSRPPKEVPGGDASQGAPLIVGYGCGTCHVIPEIPGADGNTGPPLTDMDRQAYVAGVVPNLPEALIAFIMDPQAIDPLSTMPDLGVSEEEARDMAAYLYEVGR